MNDRISIVLLVAGIFVLALGVILHYVRSIEVFPHVALLLGAIGVILLAGGAWRLWSARQNAAAR